MMQKIKIKNSEKSCFLCSNDKIFNIFLYKNFFRYKHKTFYT